MTYLRGSLIGLFIVWMVTWGGAANAATLTAIPAMDELLIGQTTSLEIVLELDAGEVASVFEGRFNLGGLGSVANASLTAGGPTWSSSVGNISGTQAIVSLTSDNQGGNRLGATLGVTGLALGVFEVSLGSPTFASFDIDDPPFLQELDITNTTGEVLTSVNVVPLPSALVLLGSGLFGIMGFRKKFKK